MNKWVSYKNGNYYVRINLADGTKIRENDLDNFRADFPESMDIKITNSCDMGCTFCLKPSAKLIVEGSTKEISKIELGDSVLSLDTNTGDLQYKPVVRLFTRDYSGELISIETASGHSISCTPNHKIYTMNRGYVRADELNKDDVLLID